MKKWEVGSGEMQQLIIAYGRGGGRLIEWNGKKVNGMKWNGRDRRQGQKEMILWSRARK